MVLTRDDALAERSRALRNLCFQKKQRFFHEELGYNYRMTNMQAALGVAQLSRIDWIVKQKRSIASAYSKRLRDVSGLNLPVEESWAKNVYWVYGVVLEEGTGLDAKQFARKLFEKGVGTRPFFLGMHEQPVFHKMGLFQDEKHPVAERLASQGLYLPTGLTIKVNVIDHVCDAVRECLN